MKAWNVLVSDKLSDAGLDALRRTPGFSVDFEPGLSEAQLGAIIAGYDALVMRSGSRASAAVLAQASRLVVIGRAGIGVDNIDVAAATARGILVMNTPTANAVTTAEHAIALLMSLARHVPQATASLRAGRWEKTRFEGRELTGKTLGIIGLGNIGRIVADRARGLKLEVIASDPALTSTQAARLGVELVGFEQLLGRSDVISIHAPLTADTRGLLDASALARTRRGVLIVNAARGGIVNERDLADALASGQVGGAALDVFADEPPDPANPLLSHERVIMTPHLGASTVEAQERVALEIAEQVAAYLTHGTVKNPVNTPARRAPDENTP